MYSVDDRISAFHIGHNDSPFAVIEWMLGDDSWEWSADDDTGEIVVNLRVLGDPLACCRVLSAVHNFASLRQIMAKVEAAPDEPAAVVSAA